MDKEERNKILKEIIERSSKIQLHARSHPEKRVCDYCDTLEQENEAQEKLIGGMGVDSAK